VEDRHDDGVQLAPLCLGGRGQGEGEVEKKILAGQFDFVDRDFAGIEQDVIGEEIRQESETAGTLEAERCIGPRGHPILDLDELFPLLEPETRSARLRSYLQVDGSPTVFGDRDSVILLISPAKQPRSENRLALT